jgi:para-nitrobenzyl esterase
MENRNRTKENDTTSGVVETVTRRNLLRGAAATLAGGAAAAMLPSAASAPKAPAMITGSGRKVISASSTKNVVETDSGKIYGYTRDGVVGYRGIPYAATTSGAGRFMPPGKVTPWAGTRSALYWGYASPQTINSTSERRAAWGHDDEAFMFEWDDGIPSEDCLRINVWTPATDNKKRAVMFWIHGGGMVAGSDNELRSYDGENLARQEDVVVVSINHRLGVLGFLNLMEYGDEYASSPNVSMLDIVAALQWVKTNISNFGGDPGRVMIFGQSGGGSKVGTLMGMPVAKGLFHRASIQSGSGLRQATVESSANLAHATLAELGVTKANLRKLHTDFTFDQIVLAGTVAQKKLAAANPSRPGVMGGINWGPVVDGKLIPRNTWDPAAPDASADVPLMVGTVLNEQANSVQMGEPNVDSIDMAEAKRRLAIVNGAHTDHLVEVFQKLHPSATPFELYSRITAMRGRLNAYKQAELKSKQGGAPAYLYWFQWQSPMCDGRARAYHTSELPFCFHNVDLCANLTGNTPEAHELAPRVAGAWAAFAKTGSPNHPGIPKWDPSGANIATMIFDNKCVAADDPDGEGRKAVLEAVG